MDDPDPSLPTPTPTPTATPPLLRDRLAVQRTALANERTFLAYGRTGIMLVSTGAVVLKVYPGSGPMLGLGGLLIAAGVGTVLLGGSRFFRVQRSLRS